MNHILFYVASLLAGVAPGLLIKSQTESKLRQNTGPWMPFGSGSSPRLLLGLAVKTVALILMFLAPFYLVSELGRHLAIAYEPRLVYLLYMIGALAGKGIRFIYWRRRDPWA